MAEVEELTRKLEREGEIVESLQRERAETDKKKRNRSVS